MSTVSENKNTVNQSSFLGSVFYNINEMSGRLFYTPTADDYLMYSDLVWINNKLYDYVTNELADESKDKFGDAYNELSYSKTVFASKFDENDFAKGGYNLLGMSWLPWFPPPKFQDSDAYIFRNTIGHGPVYFNKARSEVLMPTLMTAGKLAGITLLGWYGAKFIYRRYK